jgi:tRNA(Ile)-lysidine synthase
MTGHHGDDLMETILMRIVRGSTLKGYSGFEQVVDMGNYQIIRPLIYVTKENLQKYDDENKIPYRIDKSNYKDTYTRNRYRKYVLPFLKEEDPLVHEKFIKFSNTLLAYDGFINKLTKMELGNVYKDGIIDTKEFKNVDSLLQVRIIDYIFNLLYGNNMQIIDDRHVDVVLNTINSNKAFLSSNLPNNYLVVKEYDKVYFKKNINESKEYNYELNDILTLPNGMVLKRVKSCETDGNDILRINSNDIVLPLHVRTRKAGDKMTIKNMQGTKKVSDILINSKVALNKRDTWPIVVDDENKIIWIPKVKKSKYNRLKTDECDIIYKCL